LLVSVAQKTDATSSDFCNYSFPYGKYGLDFPKLGVDPDGIYLSANVLSTSTGQQVGNVLYFANRAAMESCGSATYTEWSNVDNPDGSLASAITPAVQDSSSGAVEYLINSYPSGACQLTLWTLTSNATLSNASVPTQCYSPPPPALQQGTTLKIDPGDSSVSHASYVNGLLTLVVAGSYDWGDGNGPVGIAEWFVLDPSVAAVSSQGAFGTPGYWLLYPAVVRDYNGNLTFVYGAAGPTSYPDLWAVQDIGGSYAPPVSLVQGAVPYTRCSNATTQVCRWGDYQAASLDDSSIDPNGVWVTGQYAPTGTSWGTKFALLPAAISLSPASGTYLTTVAVLGSGFGNGETANLYWNSASGKLLASTISSSTGTISTSVTIPQATLGNHTIFAVGQTSGQQASAVFTVNARAVLQYPNRSPGAADSATGYGFLANEKVTANWISPTGTALGSAATNSLGTSAAIGFTVPPASFGTYQVYLTGQTSGAVASTPLHITPTLTISPTSGSQGSAASFSGNGFGANETVTIRWNCSTSNCSSTTILGTVTTDATGEFSSLSVTIPSGVTTGSYAIGAQGTVSSADFAKVTFTVT
jgi:hypothetical protein